MKSSANGIRSASAKSSLRRALKHHHRMPMNVVRLITVMTLLACIVKLSMAMLFPLVSCFDLRAQPLQIRNQRILFGLARQFFWGRLDFIVGVRHPEAPQGA